MSDRFLIDNEPLVQVDASKRGMTVPHCLRCRAPLEPGVVYSKPGPFCDQCIEDIIASARSFGGGPCDMVERYNSKLWSFVQSSAIDDAEALGETA